MPKTMEIAPTTNYQQVTEYLEGQFEEVNGCDFYKFIFPDNENEGEVNTDYSKPNAVYLYQNEDSKKLKRRIMLNDTWDEDYLEYVEGNPMTLCGGLSYRGMTNKIDRAQRMNALIFDLDGVGYKEIYSLFFRFGGEPEKLRRLPMPTFLVASGSGLHIYYVFYKPIDLYPNIKLQLKALKYDLTFKMWDYKGTSQLKEIQYQSINQGFRMVGSVNSKYGTEVRAWRIGDRVTLEYMNAYADYEENRVDITKPLKPSKISLEQAKEQYPDWYQRVIVKGDKNLKKWDIKGKQGYALYNWWQRQIKQIKGGHRYFFLMCMAIYACKCDVPKKKLKKDMQEIFQDLKMIPHENELKQSDIDSALEAYDKEYYNFTRADISMLTEINIPKNKRNGRKRSQHIKMLNSTRIMKRDLMGEDEYKNNGRPSAEKVVRQWQKAHPNGRKADCIRDTKLTKPTVYKWWQQST